MKKTYFTLIVVFIGISLKALAQTTDVVNDLDAPPWSMVFGENILYVVDHNKVYKVDVSSENPVATTLITGLSSGQGLALKGNDLYIAEYSARKISKIDITSASPTKIDVITGLVKRPTGLLFKRNDLYISFLSGNKIAKINITQNSPNLVDVVSTEQPRGMVFNGSELFFTTDDGISKIDITNNSPVATSVIAGLSGAHNLILNGDDLYITETFSNKVSKINIMESNPVLTEILSGLSGPTGIGIFNNRLYISELYAHKIIKLNANLSVENDFNESHRLVVFPNPAEDFILAKGTLNSQEFSIHNVLGQKIINGNLIKDQKINVSSLRKGIYFLKIERRVVKFLKK
ncbi:MAG: T9SS type A sorting domain-containing protein [Mesonia sp.]|uniref:T9SS type A sorting domain-containing protein n=2 Tax=Mesonia sp. TaxID=1960830 RepID=UPI003F9ABD1C